MTPLAPYMMLGAAAVTVPIALHFFYRARYRPLPWAPMKFLKEAVEQTSRRLKFQEWVLLVLRCLALILLALALAQWGEKETSAVGGAQPIDAVLVFDTSYSMAAKDGDRTRLEQAKEAAVTIIDGLPSKSSVQIFSCADRAVPLGPVSAANRDQAKQIVQALEVTSLSTDLLPGLSAALTAAESGTAPSKEIYVFTDLQKSGFERQPGAVKSKCQEIKDKAGLIFIRCGNPERKIANVAVLDVQLLAAIPHIKTQVPFKVTLKNTGREPLRGLKVTLELDGKAVEKDEVPVPPLDIGATATVALTGTLDEAGPRLLTVRVTGDGLEGDNVRYQVIGVRDRVRVLLVAPPRRPDQSETESADWFARKALVPFDADKDREKVERYFIETETVAPNEAGPDRLANKDICYLLNAGARTDDPLEGLPPAFVKRLKEFVTGGGGLVIGCGDAVTAAAYNRVLGADGAGLLPLPLAEFQLTESVFENLRKANVPDAVVAKLGPLKNKALTRTEFQKALADALGAEDKNQFQDAISESARLGALTATEAAPFVPSANSIEDASVFGPIKPYAEWIERAKLSRMLALDESPEGATGARVLLRTTDNKPLVASRAVGAGEVVFFATALDETWGRMMSDGQLAVPMTTHLIAHLTDRKVPGGTVTAGDTLVWAPTKPESAYELIKPRPKTDKPDQKARPRVNLGEAKERFQLTAGVLHALRNDKVSDAVLEKLDALKNESSPGSSWPDRKEFEERLTQILSADEKDRFLGPILDRARDGPPTVRSSDTAVAGEYAIVPVGAPDPVGLAVENGATFVVNPDLRETENLDAATDDELGKMLDFRPTIIVAGAGTESAVRDRRNRFELTEYLLLALLVLLVGEAAWARFCGTAR